MKKENLKKLNDVLDISDEMIGDEFETSSSKTTSLVRDAMGNPDGYSHKPTHVPDGNGKPWPKSDLTTDYDFSRDQYQHLIEKGNTALEELLLLQKTKNEIEKKDKSSVRTENNLFVGSTKELQELLEQKKK